MTTLPLHRNSTSRGGSRSTAPLPSQRTGGPAMLKRLAGPARDYFNSRFSAVHQSVVQGHLDHHAMFAATLDRVTGVAHQVENIANHQRSAGSVVQTAVDEVLASSHEGNEDLQQSLSLLARTIDDLAARVDVLLEASDVDRRSTDSPRALAERLDDVARRLGVLSFDVARQGRLAQLAEYEATVANYVNAHDGWAAQAGLWFNPPVSVAHAPGGVSLGNVNERIAEVPYVFRSLSGLPAGSRVLDIGSTESTVALSLASLGHEVTAVDPRPYPLNHPRLTPFQGPIEEFTTDQPFDAVVLLSSIEHFGIGAYELDDADDADLAAMATVRRVSRPGTRLVLTTPYGLKPTTALERTYDPARLEKLLDGWEVEDRSYLTRVSATEWRWDADLDRLDGDHVVLVTAIRTGK